MTFEELHKILDDENRELSMSELKQVIYELKQDCFEQTNKLLNETANGEIERKEYLHKNGFYQGEQNAFQIALDLLEHYIELPFCWLDTLKLLTCASMAYANIKQLIENRMKDSKDIADLYFNMPTVQYTIYDFSLSDLAERKLDCNKINGFEDVLNAMPKFKEYLKMIKGE